MRTRQFVQRGDGMAPLVPHFVVYEPTLLCNLHCSFCYVADILNPEDWRTRELTLDELDRIFAKRGVKAVNITGGEPFVRKNLLSIFRQFQAKGMHCNYITTNGTVIDDEKAAALELPRRGSWTERSIRQNKQQHSAFEEDIQSTRHSLAAVH
jgi:MoaA/NifB/PqqE/SkfB family radical SAM enzyme